MQEDILRDRHRFYGNQIDVSTNQITCLGFTNDLLYMQETAQCNSDHVLRGNQMDLFSYRNILAPCQILITAFVLPYYMIQNCCTISLASKQPKCLYSSAP